MEPFFHVFVPFWVKGGRFGWSSAAVSPQKKCFVDLCLLFLGFNLICFWLCFF